MALPEILGLSGAWHAFGAGLIVPGSALLYAIPMAHHPMGMVMVIGHAVLLAAEVGVVAWAQRRHWMAGVAAVVAYALLVLGCLYAPHAVVVVGHVGAFIGVLAACFWAFGIRLIARADSVTLVAIIVVSAAAGALLTSVHGGGTGPMTWIPLAAFIVAAGMTTALCVRARLARRTASALGAQRLDYLGERRRTESAVHTSPVALQCSTATMRVTEASTQHLQLLRYLLGVAMQPPDQWGGFDDEAQGPLQQYRYQVNAVGWALALFNYAHTPAYAGVLTDAQLALFQRAQQKAVWGYWYWQNVLGNWDFVKRRADPIDVPQNIMFTGYLNLQLAMYRQATGDARFDNAESLVFDWSSRQRFAFDHQTINAIAIRNFDRDLFLWPCEPVLGRGRRRGYVFPYCNTVTAAGIAIMDTVNDTRFASEITGKIEEALAAECTLAANDLAAFLVSGMGVSVRRIMSGPGSTAGVAAFIAPLQPIWPGGHGKS